MKRIKRRHFLLGSLAASAVATTARPRKVSANDKVTLAMIGVGGRANGLLHNLAARPDVEIACLCDVDESKFERPLETLDSADRREPECVKDFRRVLDRSDIDGVVIATPLHWQALATIMSCQAGKDVFCEKPGSHNAYEAKMTARAARKYDRVVQIGFQNRSAPYVQKAIEYTRSGKLGNVHFVRVVEMIRGGTNTAKGAVQTPPSHLDWDFWCGPGPLTDYSPGRWWFDTYDYTGGRIFDDGVHQLDVARALIGRDDPKTVSCTGGRYTHDDGHDTPDTISATFQFGDMTLVIEGALWANYMYKTPGSIRMGDKFSDWRFLSTKVEVMGTKAMMTFGRHGGGWQVHDLERNMIASQYGRETTGKHLSNFLDCIRTRKRPNADVEEVYRSVSLWHLANAAYRAGGKTLEYDAKKVEFVGDPEASRLLRREQYRAPWALPKKV